MKIAIKSVYSFLFFVLLNTGVKAQTTLSQGDVSIVGFSGVLLNLGVDAGFAFVPWVNLSNNTQIRFTFNTFNSSSLSSTASGNANTTANQILYWQNNTGSSIAAGTVITITGSAANSNLTTSMGTVATGAVGNGGSANFVTSNIGRTLFVYQYGSTDDYDASSSTSATFKGTLIAGFVISGSSGSNTFLSSGSSSTKASYLPSDLSSSNTVSGIGAPLRSASYTGSTSFASIAAAKAAVNTSNGTNWTGISGNTNTLPTYPGNFTLPSSNTAPTFTHSSPQALTICQNSSAISINSLLTVSDVDASQTETWSVTTSPTHGTLGGFNATASSGSTSITPAGLTYTPTNGYSGSDQFIIQVSDGTATASMTVNVTVNALPTITLGSVSSVSTSVTSFSLPYSATTGSPNQYSIVTGSPTAMPSFSAVSNAALGGSPLSVTIPASAANTYNFNATVKNTTTGCVSAANAFTVTVFSFTSWNGSTWDNGAPTSSIDAIVSDVTNTAPASFFSKTLTINSGAALNTTGITATVNGDITNNGNGISGTGTLDIAAASTLSGNALTISGKLNLSAGTFTTGGLLTIAPGGAITGTYANLSGSVTLQQRIIAQRGWRMFANPFTTTQTFASLSSTNDVTIQTTGSSNAAGIADDRVWSNSGNAWSDGGTSTTANTAYGLFIRGIKLDIAGGGTGLTYAAGPTAFTYSVSGTLNGNSFTVPTANASNFSLVGNPYAAPVNSLALTGGTAQSYYLYKIAVTGNGRTKAGSWSTVLTSDNTSPIPVLGVIALKTGGNYAVTTANINTASSAATGLFGIDPPLQYAELQIEQNGNYQDNLYVRLDPTATAGGTDHSDLQKFYNDVVNLYTITSDNIRLAVDTRNVLSIIPLGMYAPTGTYNFKMNNSNLPEGTTVYLKDNLNNTQTQLNTGDTYNFSISSDTASRGEHRFELVFNSKQTVSISPDNSGTFKARVLGNVTQNNQVGLEINGAEGPVLIYIKDMEGRAVGEVKAVNGTQYINIGNTASGMLILQISDGKSSVTQKVIKL